MNKYGKLVKQACGFLLFLLKMCHCLLGEETKGIDKHVFRVQIAGSMRKPSGLVLLF